MKSTQPRDQRSDPDITTAAVEWIFEREAGFAPGRADAFHAWCEADPRHARAVAKAEQTVAMLGELADLKEPLAERLEQEAANDEQPLRHRRWQWFASWTVAAAAALALIVWRWPVGAADAVNYMSNPGHPQEVALEDGSLVDLNANTVIRAQMRPHERHVVLREGEAHFAVAHDTSRPFIVEAGGVSIRAVGTAFNVRLSDNGVEVLVLEGRIEITTPVTPGTARVDAPRSQLTVAEKAVVARDGTRASLQVEKVDQQAIRDAVAWHSTVTAISSRPLRDVVQLFNRRNTVKLVIADADLGDRTLGGSFSIDQPRLFARLLELDGDVRSEPRGENEILLHRRR